jgi:hypothetical protein
MIGIGALIGVALSVATTRLLRDQCTVCLQAT